MKLLLPVKVTVWGPVTNKADFYALIRERGQFFGEDLSGPACNFNKDYPCNQTLYQYKGWGPHKGVDIPVATGTEVFASTSGKVVEISDDVTAGIGVVIWDGVQKCKTVYWHLKSHVVKLGDTVRAGDLIAYSDTTGYADGPHLHWECKLTDDTGRSLNHVDPLPYVVWNDMLRMVKLDGPSEDIYLVSSDGMKSLIYNVGAFQKIGGNIDLVEKLTKEKLDAIPDSGVALAEIKQK